MATDKLTEIAAREAKPSARPIRRLFDSGGLYLEVRPSGARYWRHKYRFSGKEKLLSLGVYPETSLPRHEPGALRLASCWRLASTLAPRGRLSDRPAARLKPTVSWRWPANGTP